jgi:hypothetical protein
MYIYIYIYIYIYLHIYICIYLYINAGLTMDQVLFSEPSTKQKESMDAKRRAQAIASLEEEKQKLVEDGGVIDAKTR